MHTGGPKTSPVPASRIKIERLCSHHNVRDFDAGKNASLFNLVLQAYYDEVKSGTPTSVVVYVAVVNRAVIGYVAIADLEMSAGYQAKRFLSIPSTAVDRQYQGSRIFVRLLQQVLNWRERQDPDHLKYGGVACLPHLNSAIDKILAKLGFRPDPDVALYLLGPFPESNLIEDDEHDEDDADED